MRKRSSNNEISVHAIAGTQVVLLGLNATEAAAQGLLGFSILKRTGKSGPFEALGGGGGRRFKETGEADEVDSTMAPIQKFMWSDYVVEPGKTYTYRVIPLYGTPSSLTNGKSVDVTVTTESPSEGVHGIYFNRGVAGSQAYSRLFGQYRRSYLSTDFNGRLRATPFVKPADVPDRAAYKWLSRGLEEAMGEFIEQAKGPGYAIHAAVYELTYLPIIQKFVEAIERGAEVKIVHHAKRENQFLLQSNKDATTTTTYASGDKEPATFAKKEGVKVEFKDAVCQAADHAVSQVGLNVDPHSKDYRRILKAYDEMMIERTITQISHNKFMVLLKDGKPIQVWTGSTNLTEGGIFGQSNVGHIVRDPKVAKAYHDYWKKLATDPKKKSGKTDPEDAGLQNWNVKKRPLMKGLPPANSITTVFSPRLPPKKGQPEMLDWYAERFADARHSVFLTSAFSVAQQILDVAKDIKQVNGKPSTEKPYLRYLLLEGKGGLLKDKYPVLKGCPQNRVAYGDTLQRRTSDDQHSQFIETLSGLNDHVSFLHTKYMLIDPLGDDPIVMSGSANFSTASTHDNDENMLIIRGDTRVADIFLGEFMRLFNHFEYRNRENALSDTESKKARLLSSDDSWTTPYFTEGSTEQQERLLFA